MVPVSRRRGALIAADSFAAVDQAIDALFGRGASRGFPFRPAMDVREDDDRYVLTLDVPGVARDAITVDIDDGVLRISGERAHDTDAGRVHRMERAVGAFTRSVDLPDAADAAAVEASLADGVLTVAIGKRPQPEPTHIEIKAA